MFRKSQIRFEQEDLMVLTVEDTMVNRDRTGELKRVLEKVFAERCGLPVEVRFAYIPPSGGERRKQLERKIEKEAQAIYWRNHREELEAMGRLFGRGSGGKRAFKADGRPSGCSDGSSSGRRPLGYAYGTGGFRRGGKRRGSVPSGCSSRKCRVWKYRNRKQLSRKGKASPVK